MNKNLLSLDIFKSRSVYTPFVQIVTLFTKRHGSHTTELIFHLSKFSPLETSYCFQDQDCREEGKLEILLEQKSNINLSRILIFTFHYRGVKS